MTIEKQKENSPKFREVERVSKQVKEELKRFNKEKFYEKNGDEIVYNMDTVKQYLGVLKEKKTWKELISKNSSVMIMAVQIALYSLNYSFGSIDGVLGDKTKDAIKKFQADNNLPVDAYGRSMPSTIQKILEIISKEDQVEIPKEEKQEAQKIIKEKSQETTEKKSQETTEQKNNQQEGEDLNKGSNSNEENIIEDEKEKDEIDQNSIRPEIKELINSIDINGDRFKNITYLTKAEAIEISNKARGYFINFPGVKNIEPDTFEALLKFKGGIEIGITDLTPQLADKLVKRGKGITFSGLENINMETYKILGKTSGTLKFQSLKNITSEEIGELVKKPGGDIYLDAIEEINSEIAREISKYPRDISLDGVKKIDKKTAENLSNKKIGKILLKNLEAPVSEDILEELSKIQLKHLSVNSDLVSQIYNYKKQKEREGKNLSQIVLDVIDRKIGINELSKLENITNDEIEFLVKSGLYFINLSGVKNIEPGTFEALLNFKGGIEIGITDLTPQLADKLVKSGKGITFSGLENINMETYKVLGKTSGTLKFQSLKNIKPEEMGELVKKPGGDIYLDAVEEINPGIAKELSKYSRNISLNGVKKIDKETVKVLSNKKLGRLNMDGLQAPVSDDVLEELAKNSNHNIKFNSGILSQIYNYKKQKEIENQ